MNAIVVIALKRPYTFVVLAILILVFGGRAALRTPTDIFPNIAIPVVAVVWTYNGLTPEDMSGRVIYYYERSMTTTVINIEHIQSQSLYGRGVVKIFFQPGTDVAAAQAQVTAVSQTVLKQMPAGITPPQILSYNASSVPVLALQVSADQMTGSQLYDLASNLIRPSLVSVAGLAIPPPYGRAATDQRRACARTPVGADRGPEGGRRVDSRGRGGSEGQNTSARADIAGRREDHDPERCLDLRESIGRGRCTRNGDGGAVDRPGRPAVPGLRTFDVDCRHLDSALRPLLDHGARLVRADHQRGDVGRPGTRGGTPRSCRPGWGRDPRPAPVPL